MKKEQLYNAKALLTAPFFVVSDVKMVMKIVGL
jgi:hypothetical protein